MAMHFAKRNYYDVLHVSRDAPVAIIRGCYRTLMQSLKNHPDLGGDAAHAALINEAYAVLSDSERRAEYDAWLDLMAHISQGVADAPAGQETGTTSDRVPDLFRECVFCETPHDHGNNIQVDVDCRSCGSPLCAAANRRMESRDQRAIVRIDRRQDITFFTHWPQQTGFTGHTEDISPNGLCLVTRQELRKGQRIKIVSRVIEAVASVTHCKYERRSRIRYCVAGVSFVTLRFVRSTGGFVSDRV